MRESTALAGRTVVVTGAGSGIGRALAQRLSRHGCAVAITDIDEAGLAETRSGITGDVLSSILDVADAEAQRDFAQRVRDWAPTEIGAVFNNAGVTVNSRVLDGDIENDEWLWNVNFHGVVNGTRAFLPILAEQGSGAIVNTSSVWGLVGAPTQSAYCASKFAVRGYTDALAQELRGSGVRAVTVHPGGVNTNIIRNSRFSETLDRPGRTREDRAREFAAVTLTQPTKAAQIIHRGVDRGKSRILVGPDAYFIDACARITPAHQYELLTLLTGALRRRGRRR